MPAVTIVSSIMRGPPPSTRERSRASMRRITTPTCTGEFVVAKIGTQGEYPQSLLSCTRSRPCKHPMHASYRRYTRIVRVSSRGKGIWGQGRPKIPRRRLPTAISRSKRRTNAEMISAQRWRFTREAAVETMSNAYSISTVGYNLPSGPSAINFEPKAGERESEVSRKRARRAISKKLTQHADVPLGMPWPRWKVGGQS